MDLKKIIVIIICLFGALFFNQLLAQKQQICYTYKSTFKNISSIGLPDQWSITNHAHEYSLDTLDMSPKKALKFYGCANSDSVKPSILTINSFPLNRETKASFTVNIKIPTNKDSLLMAISAMDTMCTKWIKGPVDWSEFSVSIPLSNKSKIVLPQIMFANSGPCWISDVSVEMENIIYPAEEDNTFNNSSMIDSIPLDKTNIEKLVLLCKIWGFLKYYHPAVTNGLYNWDFELFRWLPDVIKAETMTELNNFFLCKIEQLGTWEMSNKKYPTLDSTYVSIRDFEWIDSLSLSNNQLSKLLSSLKNAKRSHTIYYYNKRLEANNSFPNERKYETHIYPDAGFRLLALFRYWNIIEYFYPYRMNINDKVWNNLLYKFIPKFINASNTEEYRSAINFIGTYIHDNHTSFVYADTIIPSEQKEYILPIFWDFVQEQLVVSSCLEKNCNLKPGDIVCKIDDIKIDDLVNKYSKVISASNHRSLLYSISLLLTQRSNVKTKLQIKRNGEYFEIDILGLSHRNYLSKKKEAFSNIQFHRIISDSIGYFSPIGQYRQDSLKNIMKEFENTKAIIVDLRNYPNDVLYKIADYLFPVPIACTRTTSVLQNYPGVIKWDHNQSFGRINPNYYKGTIVVLINEKTISMGESIVAILEHSPDCILIGSATAGSDGPMSTFVLPGAVYSRFTGNGFYYANKKGIQLSGILPDIKVCPTIKGIEEEKDELLEETINLIKSGEIYQRANRYR